MKINVGPLAQIVGTKKVSASGTVGGLARYAGRDVLVVVPARVPRYTATAADLVASAQAEALKRGRAALKQLRALRQRHLKTHVPGADRLLRVAPAPVRPAIRRADNWIRVGALQLEKRAERLLAN